MVVEIDGRPGSEDVEDRRLLRADVAIERDQSGALKAHAETRPVSYVRGPVRG